MSRVDRPFSPDTSSGAGFPSGLNICWADPVLSSRGEVEACSQSVSESNASLAVCDISESLSEAQANQPRKSLWLHLNCNVRGISGIRQIHLEQGEPHTHLHPEVCPFCDSSLCALVVSEWILSAIQRKLARAGHGWQATSQASSRALTMPQIFRNQLGLKFLWGQVTWQCL